MDTSTNPLPDLDEDIQVDLEIADLEKTPEGEDQAPVKSAEEGIEELRRQYEEEKAQRQKAFEERNAAELARQRAVQEAEQWRNTATSREQQAAEAAMHNAEQAVASARAKARAAYETGDYDAALEAQEEIARQTYRVEQFKGALEAVKSRPAPKMERNEPDPLAQYSPRTREWIKAHPEYLNNPKVRVMADAAHYRALDAGLEAESDAYFAAIETELGYRQRQEPPPKREGVVAAPPSRGDTSPHRPSSPTRVTLTAAERELAAQLNIPEKEYARNKVKVAAAEAARGY